MTTNINKCIEDAFNSIDGIKKASGGPFFFTRLEARMQREKGNWEKISSFVARPLVAFACICMVIMINAAVIFSSEKSSSTKADNQNNELATMDEYNQVNSTFYEFVNAKP